MCAMVKPASPRTTIRFQAASKMRRLVGLDTVSSSVVLVIGRAIDTVSIVTHQQPMVVEADYVHPAGGIGTLPGLEKSSHRRNPPDAAGPRRRWAYGARPRRFATAWHERPAAPRTF